MQLAEAEPLEGLGVHPHGLGADAGAQRARPGEEEVPGEDRDVVAPQRVGAVGAAAGGRRVHHVVVVEAGQVGQLDEDRRLLHALGVDVPEGCGQEHEHRADTLAAGVHEVASGPAHHVVGARDGFAQPVLDGAQALDDARRELIIDVGHTRQRGRHVSPGDRTGPEERGRSADCAPGQERHDSRVYRGGTGPESYDGPEVTGGTAHHSADGWICELAP